MLQRTKGSKLPLIACEELRIAAILEQVMFP